MKKRDIIIIAVVLCLAAVSWTIPRLLLDIGGTKLQITVDGDVYGVYSLYEDQEIVISDTNVCMIQDGVVKMTDATCPDHLCIKQRAIDQSGGTIVCLPNHVVLEITGSMEEEVDVIAN